MEGRKSERDLLTSVPTHAHTDKHRKGNGENWVGGTGFNQNQIGDGQSESVR